MVDATGNLIMQQSVINALINTEVLIPHGELMALARVLRSDVDESVWVIRNHNDNPLLNKLVYECEFLDSTSKYYAANIIDDNVLIESDLDG